MFVYFLENICNFHQDIGGDITDIEWQANIPKAGARSWESEVGGTQRK